jgi:hypothetical protein
VEILGGERGEGDSANLLMYNSPQPSLPLDNSIRHAHLPAQRRQKHNQLNRINIIRNKHQRSLLVLYQPDHVVQPVLNDVRLLAHILLLLAVGYSSGFLVQPLLLLGFGLGPVLVEEAEGLGCGVAVEGVRELGDGGGHFEAKIQYLLLALETDVFGPFDHAREVAAWLDVLADTEVAGAFLEEGVLICVSGEL